MPRSDAKAHTVPSRRLPSTSRRRCRHRAERGEEGRKRKRSLGRCRHYRGEKRGRKGGSGCFGPGAETRPPSPGNQVRSLPPPSGTLGGEEVDEKTWMELSLAATGVSRAKGGVALIPHVTGGAELLAGRIGSRTAAATPCACTAPSPPRALDASEHARKARAGGPAPWGRRGTDTCTPLPPCWFPRREFSRGRSCSRGSWPEAGWRRGAERDG